MGATTGDSAITDGTEVKGTGVASTGSNARTNERSGVSRDDLFDVLSNRRRRYALHSLKGRDGAVGIGDLAEEIAAWENGIPRTDLTAAERKRVYTALQQFHLPKMDATELISFDDSRGTVALADTANSLDVYLDVVADDDIPWSRYYLGLSALSLVAVVGVRLADLPEVSALAVAALVAVVFGVSALAHTYHDHGMRLGTPGPPPDAPDRRP